MSDVTIFRLEPPWILAVRDNTYICWAVKVFDQV